MARVTADLPRPSEVVAVDSKALLEDEEDEARAQSYDPETGLPRSLRAFVVCRDPRMTVVPHFFSEPECDHLIKLVDGYWMPSLVGQATYSSEAEYSKGDLENTLSKTRTSWSCMLRYSQTAVVERLEHRLASLCGLPTEQLERMNMVRYAPGELFNEHHDGKFRPITIFVYLNDVPEGEERGDTFFPCLGLSFRPRRGTAVMWGNVDEANDQEDSRMLHAGRAPTSCVKYGVNCFFNVRNMRQLAQVGAEVPVEQAAVVQVHELGGPASRPPPLQPEKPAAEEAEEGPSGDDGGGPKEPKLVAYRLCQDPKLLAVPAFLSSAEVDHLLSLLEKPGQECAAGAGADAAGFYREAAQTLRSLEPAETPTVESVERRLCATSGLSLGSLARLRLVRPGTKLGLCNRGCGPKSAYVCLAARDEVFFPRLGIRLVLRRGDLAMWPNVDWETGKAVEDVRTMRVHVRPEGCGEGDIVGLDAFFHDNPVREQQQQRKFVHDWEAAAVAVGEAQ